MKKSIIKYNDVDLEKYLKALSSTASFTRLFSENGVPYLVYRAVENIYCSIFNALNLSRSDISIDVKYREFGLGIKTFIDYNRKSYQKIAEFNAQRPFYDGLDTLDKMKKIAELRNKRLSLVQDTYSINKLVYHCVVRNNDGLFLYEENMNFLNEKNIKIIQEKGNSIIFTDGTDNYKFDLSKSTLFKKFLTDDYFANVNVDVLADPLEIINKVIPTDSLNIKINKFIILPLYSYDDAFNKKVFEKSGLNQWNAEGRKRNADEVYIPFPSEVRNYFENFFPDRNTPFNVELPNGKQIKMKVCQSDGKAIMSNPNKDLGKWILRDILKVPEGELVTYNRLLEMGVDSVGFEKINNIYKLNFKEVGCYEDFLYDYIIEDI